MTPIPDICHFFLHEQNFLENKIYTNIFVAFVTNMRYDCTYISTTSETVSHLVSSNRSIVTDLIWIVCHWMIFKPILHGVIFGVYSSFLISYLPISLNSPAMQDRPPVHISLFLFFLWNFFCCGVLSAIIFLTGNILTQK